MGKLKVGQKVWLRDDLKHREKYGSEFFIDTMTRGRLVEVECIGLKENDVFFIVDCIHAYSYDMIDWDETKNIPTENDSVALEIKSVFDSLVKVGFTREEALQIMIKTGNVGKNA